MRPAPQPRFTSPETYTPRHLAEKILTARTALEGERKQVTVLFADLKGSMELLADRDPEQTRKLLDPVLEYMMDAVHHYEGTVNQVMGDGIMALFGAPLAHEDHAVRACYAALRMQESVRHYADEVRRTEGIPIQIRVGLNSGEVVVRSIGSDLRMDYTAVGQTTHLAARMEQMAAPGTVLTTGSTLSLVEGWVESRSLGPMPVKGLEAPLEVCEIVGAGAARSRLQASARRGLSRFVGRTPELDQLREALERAAAGRGQVVAVVGSPGWASRGSSTKSSPPCRSPPCRRPDGVLESRSVSYGKSTPYLPVADLLKGYFQIEGRDTARQIRDKVTGRLLALDPAREATLAPLLALLDVPVDEPRWQSLDPRSGGSAPSTRSRRSSCARARSSPCSLLSRISSGWTARRRPSSTASWRACPSPASPSSSIIGPSTRTAGAARPTMPASGSTPCMPTARPSSSTRSSAMIPVSSP